MGIELVQSVCICPFTRPSRQLSRCVIEKVAQLDHPAKSVLLIKLAGEPLKIAVVHHP